jgi:hypothetical protein
VAELTKYRANARGTIGCGRASPRCSKSYANKNAQDSFGFSVPGFHTFGNAAVRFARALDIDDSVFLAGEVVVVFSELRGHS